MTDESPMSTPVHSESSSSSEDENHVRNTRIGDQLASEPEGEDLYATMREDYRAIPSLDNYDRNQLDDETGFDALTADQRQEAEFEIRRRYQASRGPAALDWDSEDELALVGRRNQIERQRRNHNIDTLDDLLAVDTQQPIVLQEVNGPLSAYLQRSEIRREIMRRFQDFLVHFKDSDNQTIYIDRINTMVSKNRSSLEVNYSDIANHTPIIGIWLEDAPDLILDILDEAAFALVTNKAFFPQYYRISPQVHVRISQLPVVDQLRDLRQSHLNALVRTEGVVTKRTSVMPQLSLITWVCGHCGQRTPPIPCTDEKPIMPTFCSNCDAKGGFRIDSSFTVYRNYQKLTIQEPPWDVPAGRLPRTKEVILHDDLADCCRPGEQIDITGVYKHSMDVRRQGFPVFSTIIEANHVQTSGNAATALNITEEDKAKIIELSKDPNVANRIFEAIAPSIFGHRNIKAAIALSLFGGHSKANSSIRGDINVLLLGDPGTAKSQFLKYAESIAPRAVFTNGKGASAVGLTAAVHRDQVSGEWTLEGGALVLADGGVCLIDEFDKMSDKDRTSIHEAMEQQSISISKAGIVTSLQARCSVIAACNPVSGRYDQSVSFLMNSGLSDPIISRFDVLCVVRDVIDPINDEKMADFVVKTHRGMKQPSGDIDQQLLKKYIYYARENVHPMLSDIDKEKLVSLYTEIRRESALKGSAPITMRSFESIIRLAEAHAKLHLRSTVIQPDVNFAISMVLESFISTEKYSNMKELKRKFGKYLVYSADQNDLLIHILHSMIKERLDYLTIRRQQEMPSSIRIQKSEFEARANDKKATDITDFYQSAAFKRDFSIEGSEIVRSL